MLERIQAGLNLRPDWPHPVHDWLKQVEIAFVDRPDDPVLRDFLDGLKSAFEAGGHTVLDTPNPDTRVLVGSGRFGEDTNWRRSLMFTGRRKFGLADTPTVFTAMRATHAQLETYLDHFARVIPNDPPDPADYDFPGLSPRAYKTLFEQGTRGGPLMALTRLLQSQSKCIRLLLVVGDESVDYVHVIDLVGAHPRIDNHDEGYFYHDVMLRMTTVLSTSEITNHRVVEPPIPRETWLNLTTVDEMCSAALELGKRNFFTEMVMIANLVHVPSISSAVASQYSEGCFATWDPQLDALVATVTGSARPVEKDAITEDDLAVITGIRDDGSGAVVRHVEGKINDPPSSESVEMMEMDAYLPRIRLDSSWNAGRPVPIVRSKLHGHRGVAGFDPAIVEFVPLQPAFYHYPVSCATEAQAQAIVEAFARAETLKNPADDRQAAFTILPGHGLVLVEKWVPGKRAFQFLYELMDSGGIDIANHIPQGDVVYEDGPGGRKILRR